MPSMQAQPAVYVTFDKQHIPTEDSEPTSIDISIKPSLKIDQGQTDSELSLIESCVRKHEEPYPRGKHQVRSMRNSQDLNFDLMARMPIAVKRPKRKIIVGMHSLAERPLFEELNRNDQIRNER